MREQGEVTPVGRIVSETTDYNNRYFPVIRRVVETPDFQTREPQYLLDRSGKTFVASVVMTETGNILFVREPKYGQMDYFLVVPTGAVKNGETPEQAAARETLEETGYIAGNFTVINSRVVSMADKIDGGEHTILVADGAKKVQKPEQSRQVIELTREEAEKLLNRELEDLQLDVDISRLALFEALRFMDKNELQKTQNTASIFIEKARSIVLSLDPDTTIVDLLSNQDWLAVYDNASPDYKSMLSRTMHRIVHEMSKAGKTTPTIAHLRQINESRLARIKFVGQRSIEYIKQIFPTEIDSPQETK